MNDISYEKILKSARPITIPKHIVKQPKGSLSAPVIAPEIVIPPLNSDIRFSSILPEKQITQIPGFASLQDIEIPENFCWGIKDNLDSDAILKKKQLITQPQNQMLCGSCWAISTAGIISDNFVVSGLVDYPPNLSTTWCLSCYPQLRCNGGNAAKLFNDIKMNGITSNNCVDYSWCSKNNNCNGSGTKHFSAETDLSKMIPSCGCYNSGKFLLYKINDVYSVENKNQTDEEFIKRHIFLNGPIMGGYVVYGNFMSGIFTNPNINEGVYFENGIYDGSGEIKYNDNFSPKNDILGAHAIAIVGWGIAKNCQIDNIGTINDVPYWYCRNSWGSKWGMDGGFFKMAMYPFNKFAQFDRIVNVGNFRVGGMVRCKASSSPELTLFNSNNYNGSKEQPDDFYKMDKFDKNIYPNNEKSKNNGAITNNIQIRNIILYISISIILLVIIVFIIKTIKK